MKWVLSDNEISSWLTDTYISIDYGLPFNPHSIRINEQWRIVFRWQAGNAFEAEVTDYH
ncbi:MAG: hypothetical protein ABFS22_01115 [Pseudomonadota bacterium]